MFSGCFTWVQTLVMGNNDPDIFGACVYKPDADAALAVGYLQQQLPLWGLPQAYVTTILEGTYADALSNCTAGPGPEGTLPCCRVVELLQLDYMMIW